MAKPTFSASLIGVRFFQSAISRCAVGEHLSILHEYDNPHDDRAVLVKSALGESIGYISRGNFLKRALLDEQQECAATIGKIVSKAGISNVVMEVKLFGRTGHPIARCRFHRK